jgi:hypothetical protein
MDNSLEFTVTLDTDAWNKVMAGWNCDALRIPDAKVVALYHGGRQADERDYLQKDTMLLWTSGVARPAAVAVRIRLPSDLKKASDVETVEKQKLKLEEDKVKIEREKLASENRWKKYTVIAGVFATIVSATVTYKISQPKMPETCKQSLVKLRAAADPNLPGQTLEKLRNAVGEHATACNNGE